MIRSCFSAADNSRIIIAPLYDVTYNDSVWITRVHNAINDLITTAAVADTGDDKFKIGVIGHLKDDTSYYLRLFPHWGLVAEENYKGINSTDLRELFFYHRCSLDEIRDRIPESVVHYLEQFKITDDYTYVTKEYDCVRKFSAALEWHPLLAFFCNG